MTTTSEAKCPFHHAAGSGTSNRDWWPNALRVDGIAYAEEHMLLRLRDSDL